MPTSITVTELAELGDVTILDVRKKPAYDDDTVVINRATWRDPAKIDDWGGDLARDRPVVCYCVHGREVSQGASQALRRSGFDARYLEGGIEDWKASGGRLAPKP